MGTDTFSIRTNAEDTSSAAEESFKEESKVVPSVKSDLESSLDTNIETIELSKNGISSSLDEKDLESTVERINVSSADDATKINEEHIDVSQSEEVHSVKEEQSLVQSSEDDI